MSFTFFDRNGNPSEFTTEAFISSYEKYYFLHDENDSDFIPGVSVNSCVSENKIERILSEGISRREDVNTILAWKIGGIDHKKSKKEIILKADWKNKANVRERYFKCKSNDLDCFCAEIVDIAKNYQSGATPDNTIKQIAESTKKYNIPLGPVYILTILYFITKKEYPIFDRFAYTAVKAIYAGVKPKDIWYENPSSKSAENVIKVINEYKWFLKQVFGFSQIPRNIDRALWVYGHQKAINS